MLDGARFPSLGRPSSFEVDTSGAGLGELAIQCRGPNGNVPVDVRPTSAGKYIVSYIPNHRGEYNIRFMFNGEDITGSPYTTFVTDPTQIVTHGEGLNQAVAHSESKFFITLYGADKRDLDVKGEGPDGRFPVKIDESSESPDTYDVRYTPKGIGEHKIYVSHASIPVRGSPFVVKVADPTQVKFATHINGSKPKQYVVQNKVDIPVEVPRSAGDGNLEASVLGPDNSITAASVEEEQDGYHHIRFVPRTAGEHKVRVLYGGQEVSSPYSIQVHEAVTAKVKEVEPYYAKQEVRDVCLLCYTLYVLVVKLCSGTLDASGPPLKGAGTRIGGGGGGGALLLLQGHGDEWCITRKQYTRHLTERKYTIFYFTWATESFIFYFLYIPCLITVYLIQKP